MKILFNTMNLGKGGAERVINILSNEFAKINEVKIITNLNMPIEYNFNNKIEIVSIEKKHSKNRLLKFFSRISYFKLMKLKREILLFNPDIIISFLPEPSFRVLILKKFFKKIKKIPIVVSVRNDPNIEYNNLLYKKIMNNLYPLADELVLQTEDSKKYFIKEIGKQGIVIHNPVSDAFIIPKYNGEREKKIVAVGRLEQQKDYFTMIKAFKIFSDKNSEYILEIYGDGSQKKELKKIIADNHLNNKVILMGKTDDVLGAIYKSSAFIMTSIYEGMPNSLLEASCVGVPCVSTDCPCGGPREILNKGEYGLLTSVGDFEDIALKIETIIKNKELSNTMSTKANDANSNYSKEFICKKWLDLIKEMVGVSS